MTAIRSRLALLPYCQFRKNRYFYPMYDGFFLAATVVLLAFMQLAGWQSPVQHWSWSLLGFLPLVAYAQILCSVFIHVCTHKSLPNTINRLVGEFCGVVVLTRFASWEIIHQRHHQYSDDLERDPHPVLPGYFAFMFQTIAGVETQLQRIFFELHGGKTEKNLRFEKNRARLSYFTSLLLIFAWYRVLGPVIFVELFVPASIMGFFHLVHFNWSTHNAAAAKDFQPVNLNQGWFRLGNKVFLGIYMHKNHHDRPSVLNPAHMQTVQPRPRILASAA